jgi:hypothetical protein
MKIDMDMDINMDMDVDMVMDMEMDMNVNANANANVNVNMNMNKNIKRNRNKTRTCLKNTFYYFGYRITPTWGHDDFGIDLNFDIMSNPTSEKDIFSPTIVSPILDQNI